MKFQGSDTAGWVEDFGFIDAHPDGGSVTFRSDARAYLVPNIYARDWWGGSFKTFHLKGQTISFTVDLSNVGCGCIACLYFVPLRKPGPGSNYCDGQTGGCIEIDIMEANMMAFHTSLHTEEGSAFDGSCNGNGCAANLGRYPYTVSGLRTKDLYGPGAKIDSKKPFQVSASWDSHGSMTIHLAQGEHVVPLFNATSAGNFETMHDGGHPDPWNYSEYPKPGGVPYAATGKAAWNMDQGLRLVASLWDGGDTFWLDHAACKGEHWCDLSSSSFKVSDMQMVPNAGASPAGQVHRKFASPAVPGLTARRHPLAGPLVALAAASTAVVGGILVVRRKQVLSSRSLVPALEQRPRDALLE